MYIDTATVERNTDRSPNHDNPLGQNGYRARVTLYVDECRFTGTGCAVQPEGALHAAFDDAARQVINPLRASLSIDMTVTY